MTSLKHTLQNIQKMRAQFDGVHREADGAQWLVETKAFGPNPGGLRMLSHSPKGATAGSALVVVLHGCKQTAQGYADQVGWRALADRHGFRLLCPEQTSQNNASGCFNWFLPADIAREGGECHSIHSMIRQMTGGQKTPVFITGLSAGGAMACAMLATYPECFAGGSIIAGLPFGCAHDVQSAFAAMHQPRRSDAPALGGRIRLASRHEGPWPPVAIWHGDADRTVLPENANELCRQWLDVHGLQAGAAEERSGHTVWRDGSGRIAVSRYIITGMGHGAPVKSMGINACGRAAPFVLEAGISSSLVMAEAWGLAEAIIDVEVLPPETRVSASQPRVTKRTAAPKSAGRRPLQGSNDHGSFIERTIRDALKSAGLIKS